MAKRPEKKTSAVEATADGNGTSKVKPAAKAKASPAEKPPAPAPPASDKDLDAREVLLRERESALQALLLDVGRREAALAVARQDLDTQAQTLEQREEELFIREAAMDEAETLAAEMESTLTASETQAALQSGDLLEGTPDAEDILLEGPAVAAVYESTAAATTGKPPAEAPKPAAPAHDEEAEKAARAEEQLKLRQEAEALLTLTRDLPFLSFVEPRLQRAQADGKMDYPTMLGFYGLATRLIRDEWEKLRTVTSRQDDEYRRVLREKEKALVDANAAVTSLQEDFERHRNRTRTEQEGMTVRANEELLRRIVPISDNFSRALAASETATNVEAVLSGVKMIYRLFDDVFSQEGLVPIKAEKGDAFNPKVHEALMEIETIEVADDTIYEVIQRGFMLGGKVFRPALVKVAREPRA